MHPCTYPSIYPFSTNAPSYPFIIHRLPTHTPILYPPVYSSAIHTTHPLRHAATSPPIPLYICMPSTHLPLHPSIIPLPIQPPLELLTVNPSTHTPVIHPLF